MNFFRRTITAVALIGPMLVGGSAMASSIEDYFAGLDGGWSGRSTVNFIARGTQESVLCKLTVKIKKNGTPSLSGACALAGAKLQFKSTKVQYLSDSEVKIELKSNTNYGGEVIGTLKGDVLTFSMPVYDEKARKPYVATAVVKPDGSDLSLDFNFAEKASGKRTSEVYILFGKN